MGTKSIYKRIQIYAERETNRFPENASFTIEGRSRMKKGSPQMKAAGF